MPVSLLVIYSGQSVPPLSPSPREDEEEWCCFIMYFSTMCEKRWWKWKRAKCGIKRGFFEIVPFWKKKKLFFHNKSEERPSRGGIFNYSLVPTSQSGKVAQLWGVHKNVVISIGYPVDKSGHVQKLHTIAQASLQPISFQMKSKRLNQTLNRLIGLL